MNSASLTLLDLAAARLWVATRSVEAIDQLWPAWSIEDMPLAEWQILEPNPDKALVDAIRKGTPIGVYGVPEGGDTPEPLPPYVWPYAVLSADCFGGNIGRVNTWRGVTVDANALRKAFPPLKAANSPPSVRARLKLSCDAEMALTGKAPVPVGAVWREWAVRHYGIRPYRALTIWNKVARSYPLLSEVKGKKKRRLRRNL